MCGVICIWVCGHVHIQVNRGVLGSRLLSTFLPRSKVFQWTISSLFWQGWPVSKLSGPTCLHLPMLGLQAWVAIRIFMWVLWIWTRVLMLANQHLTPNQSFRLLNPVFLKSSVEWINFSINHRRIFLIDKLILKFVWEYGVFEFLKNYLQEGPVAKLLMVCRQTKEWETRE